MSLPTSLLALVALTVGARPLIRASERARLRYQDRRRRRHQRMMTAKF